MSVKFSGVPLMYADYETHCCNIFLQGLEPLVKGKSFTLPLVLTADNEIKPVSVERN